jgi:anti-sigma B factor antagonist
MTLPRPHQHRYRVDVDLAVTRDADGCAVLTVIGEVELEYADQLVETALATITTEAHQALHIDLSQVTFIDSTGLGALIRIRNATGDALALLNPSRQVIRLLELTGLSDIFTIR